MTRTRSPAEVAAEALGVALSDILSVEPIKHGLANESWRVRTRAGDVVVRCTIADDASLRVDRDSEARVLIAVADANIGAPVVQCDAARHLLVTRFVGEVWTQEHGREPRNIERLAHLLRRLHALPPPSGVRTVSFAATAAAYAETLAARHACGALCASAMLERARIAAAAVGPCSSPRLCHNDVHHLNVVDAGELRLVDWEYAGLGEPLFDLAAVCVYHRYDANQREALLAAYDARSRTSQSRLDGALWLFDYVRDLWTAVRALT